MSAQLDTSHFPIPKEVEEKLTQLEKRISLLEKDKVQIHKIGIPSALSEQFVK